MSVRTPPEEKKKSSKRDSATAITLNINPHTGIRKLPSGNFVDFKSVLYVDGTENGKPYRLPCGYFNKKANRAILLLPDYEAEHSRPAPESWPSAWAQAGMAGGRISMDEWLDGGTVRPPQLVVILRKI